MPSHHDKSLSVSRLGSLVSAHPVAAFLACGPAAHLSRVMPHAGSGNSDVGFSGNSGGFELTPSSHTLAVPNSEGRDDRHAQAARDSGASTRRSQSNRN